MTESIPLPNWERDSYQQGGYKPQLFYAVYGDLDNNSFQISRLEHRCDGIPNGLNVQIYQDHEKQHMMWPFEDDPLKSTLENNDKKLFEEAQSSRSCILIRGEVDEYQNLNYLRNTIGLVQVLLENGGIAVLDLFTFSLLDKDKWKAEIFGTNQPSPCDHVVIRDSEQDNQDFWLHTRGMIKFGRPDLSVHNVKRTEKQNYADLINRLINLQAFGGMIPEGQSINMKEISKNLKCYNEGSMDCPDFNNYHIEIR